MKKYWKIIIPLLFALAIALGLIQRNTDPYLGGKTTSYNFAMNDKSLADYYFEAEKYGRNTNQSQVSFLAVGDIILSRKVALEMQKNKDPLLPFLKMADIFESVNFSFGNLESPANGTEYFNSGETLVFNAPKEYLQGLNKYKFKILNLANNHALDQGKTGLEYTLKYLNDNGVKHTGTGKNLDEAWQPAIVEQNGIKICFLGASYASINDGGKTENNYVARIEDIKNLKLKIKNSKSLCDFVVISMHAGIEYVRKPNQSQINFAHAAIDYGADMVIGHHPHWVQTIERYAPNCPSPIHGEGAPSASEGRERLKCGDPKYIFYSLGNFIFDQMWSHETREGLALKVTISKAGCHPEGASASEGSLNQLNLRDSSTFAKASKDKSDALGMTNKGACSNDLQGPRQPAKLESVELIPIIIDNYSTPRPANEEETKKILEKIDISSPLLK